MIDNYHHIGQREKLIKEIHKKGISNVSILEAMRRIPRHFFLDKSFEKLAYQDRALPIAANQTISQPYTVAFQSSLLEPKHDDKVLEIGTGSGYQAAVLLELGVKLYSIERQFELFGKTKKLLNSLGYFPQLFFGDGFKGKPTYGPFDKILITAGAPVIPSELLKQLKIGGFMVIPLNKGNYQEMLRITKTDDNKFEEKYFGAFSFVPMLQGTAGK